MTFLEKERQVMKQLLLMILWLSSITVQAQIPAEVKDILKKCGENSHFLDGTEMEAKVKIASMKMTVTKIKLGVSDNVFVLDPKKYPNAVVVRK